MHPVPRSVGYKQFSFHILKSLWVQYINHYEICLECMIKSGKTDKKNIWMLNFGMN